MRYTCNLCGHESPDIEMESLRRESGSCERCGSFPRLRSLAYLLGRSLFDDGYVPAWPLDSGKRVLGVSDWLRFGEHYDSRITYVNTQFDRDLVREHYLDICDPPAEHRNAYDAVSCADVLEHVAPPVQPAFKGLYSVLRPGGVLVLTVPYTFARTVEHYPNLHHWRVEERDGARIVVNQTVDGDTETFEKPVFHGGGTAVLEMRLFGLNDLLARLRTAGFTDVEVFEDDALEFGIRYAAKWSLPIIARKR